SVEHQVYGSRLYNVIGNIMYHTIEIEAIKEWMFGNLLKKYANKEFFISTDPLTAMIIPRRYIQSENCAIVHIERDAVEFANSIFKLSRKKNASYIAHNFIPFWQPYLWPLENMMSGSILKKYAVISERKNEYFKNAYSECGSFQSIEFVDLFEGETVKKLINDWFKTDIDISTERLQVKSNVT
ncbi:MAG: hypothetical protein HKN22_02745, partial [Bacteroidia bacterium]|nr:hypothetical protein [Bacteroidia bacterium]